MTWFVLVPGACHGGWWFESVASALTKAGHTADAVTLRGLDPQLPADPGAINGAINLDTHIDEVAELIVSRGEPAVLVGHSYAGSVITGVADQLPAQISGLLYLDAFVPRDGDSCWSMTNDQQRHWYGEGSGRTGFAVDPLPSFADRARPHPLGTLMQKSRLTGAYEDVPRKHYVAATGAAWLADSPFVPFARRLRARPDWTVIDLDSGHNVLAHGHGQLLGLILDLA